MTRRQTFLAVIALALASWGCGTNPPPVTPGQPTPTATPIVVTINPAGIDPECPAGYHYQAGSRWGGGVGQGICDPDPTPAATPINVRPILCVACMNLPAGLERDLCRSQFCDPTPAPTPTEDPCIACNVIGAAPSEVHDCRCAHGCSVSGDPCSPTQAPTVGPTLAPTAPIPSASPTSAPVVGAVETPYPVGGECVSRSGAFNAEIHLALTAARLTHPDLIVAGHTPYRVKDGKHYEFDLAVLASLRAQGLDAVVDGNCGPWGCDEIAVAKHGDGSFHEQYALLVSNSGDFRDVATGDAEADKARCSPRGFPLSVGNSSVNSGSSTPTATPAPTPVTQASTCPCLNRIDLHRHGAPDNSMSEENGSFDADGNPAGCYPMDSTPRFGTGNCGPGGCTGLPDNDDHRNFGNHCEFLGEPIIATSDRRIRVRWDEPTAAKRYTFRICGPYGLAFTARALPPKPLLDSDGKAVSVCGLPDAPDGGTTFEGQF